MVTSSIFLALRQSVRIWSYSGTHFSRIFSHSDRIRRETEYLSVFSPNVGKMQARIAPYTKTFDAVWLYVVANVSIEVCESWTL